MDPTHWSGENRFKVLREVRVGWLLYLFKVSQRRILTYGRSLGIERLAKQGLADHLELKDGVD